MPAFFNQLTSLGHEDTIGVSLHTLPSFWVDLSLRITPTLQYIPNVWIFTICDPAMLAKAVLFKLPRLEWNSRFRLTLPNWWPRNYHILCDYNIAASIKSFDKRPTSGQSSVNFTGLLAFILSLFLQESPIYGFRFVENLDFLQTLTDKYADEVVTELAAVTSSDWRDWLSTLMWWLWPNFL